MSPDGPADFSRIQDALDASIDGDYVILASGVYRGDGNRAVSFRGKSVCLRSSGGAEACVIDCEHVGCAFVFETGEGPGAVLDGLTICNGEGFAGEFAGAFGGAIACFDASPTIVNCIFNMNRAQVLSEGFGGAVYSEGGRPTIGRCLFDENVSCMGGALYGSYEIVSECTFVANWAVMLGMGCAGYFNANCLVERCTFVANTSSSQAAVLECFLGGGQIQVAHCIMAFNQGNACRSAAGTGFELSCCDVFGNAGGDWVGELTGQLEARGNLCLDPLFCDAEARVYLLHEDSPCAPGGSCGLIGPWSVGCGPAPACEFSWGSIKKLFWGP